VKQQIPLRITNGAARRLLPAGAKKERMPVLSVSGLCRIYLLVINIFGFCLMGSDKRKARRNQWRIPEKTLFLAALLGGSVDTLAGMYFFRHKTKHWYFVVGMPAILILQAGLALYLLYGSVY